MGLIKFFIFLLSFLLLSCNKSIYLKTSEIKNGAGIEGSFNLILYGGNYFNDLETVAILDIANDDYVFEPFAPEFRYRVIETLNAEDAFRTAERFVSQHHAFYNATISKIFDTKGSVIGYEVRPLYHPYEFGTFNTIDIDYILREKKVVVKIRLLDHLERRLFDTKEPDTGQSFP